MAVPKPHNWEEGYFVDPGGYTCLGYYPKSDDSAKIGLTKVISAGWACIDRVLETHQNDGAVDRIFIIKGKAAHGKEFEISIKATDASDSRKLKAVLDNEFIADDLGKLNLDVIRQLSSKTPSTIRLFDRPTWDKDNWDENANVNVPLLPGVGLVEDIEFRLSPKIPAEVYDGDLINAKAVLRNLLSVHMFAPILVAVVLGSPAIARWHKSNRFGLALWGPTGRLKTTMVLIVMAVYGIGYLDGPKLKAGKAGSTTVGAMEMFSAAGFLPQIYDDVKTVDAKDEQNYVAVMHSVLEGEEKARGKKDGGLRISREFLCTPIATGEVRPQEASTSARVLNLNWTLVDGTSLSQIQENAGLLPIIGYYWLRFLAGTNYVLGKDFEAVRNKKMEEFLGLQYVNPGRLATIYTLLIAIWDLLEASPLGDVFTEHKPKFKEALQIAIDTQGVAVSEETEISRFLSSLEELLASKPALIQSVDGMTLLGSVIGKWMPDGGLFLLPTETLNELNKIKTFTQQPTIDSITQALNDKGMLVRGEDRHLKCKVRLNGARPRGWYLKSKLVLGPLNPGLVPPPGAAKIDGSGSNGPGAPLVPPKKKENIFNDEKDEKIIFDKTSGTYGASGAIDDIDRIDRVVDSDIDNKVSKVDGPISGPIDQSSGSTPVLTDDLRRKIEDAKKQVEAEKKDLNVINLSFRLLDMGVKITPTQLEVLKLKGQIVLIPKDKKTEIEYDETTEI